MRIVDSTNLGNSTPVQTGRTGELYPIDRAGKNSFTAKTSSTGDSVDLSSFTGRLSQTMQEASATRANRIEALSASVRSGSYQVDAAAVSHAMVSQAISSGSSGKA